ESAMLTSGPHEALPVSQLHSALKTTEYDWSPRLDLLNDGPTDPVFVAEVEADGTVLLRFGDGRHGLRPESGTAFTATYRVGVGVAGGGRGGGGGGDPPHVPRAHTARDPHR